MIKKSNLSVPISWAVIPIIRSMLRTLQSQTITNMRHCHTDLQQELKEFKTENRKKEKRRQSIINKSFWCLKMNPRTASHSKLEKTKEWFSHFLFFFFFPFNVGFYIISNSWKHYVFVLTSVAFRSYRVLYAGVPAVAWHTSLISNFFTWPEIWVLFEVKCETLIFGPYTNPWVFLGPTRCLSNIVLKDLRLSEIFRMCYRCSSLPTHLPTLTEMIVSVYVKSIAFSQGEKKCICMCVYI